MASVWVGLARIATLVAIWFKIWAALSEIVVGTVAQLIIGAFVVHGELGALREMPFDPGQLVAQLGRAFLSTVLGAGVLGSTTSKRLTGMNGGQLLNSLAAHRAPALRLVGKNVESDAAQI